MQYLVKCDGKVFRLSSRCSKNLYDLAFTMVRKSTSRWRDNSFHVRIFESNGVVSLSVYGLSKVNWSCKVSISDILRKGNDAEEDLYIRLYDLLKNLTEENIYVDDISFDFIPGRTIITGDLMDPDTTVTYAENKIKNIIAYRC